MKTPLFFTTLFAATLATGTAFADDDCNDPIANWQPREALRQMLEDKGWEVQRIKVDDGCYEVKGLDQDGNKVKAEYFPASLRLRKLETKFKQNSDVTDELPNRNKQKSTDKQSNRDNGGRS